jgi:hypothetical protein
MRTGYVAAAERSDHLRDPDVGHCVDIYIGGDTGEVVYVKVIDYEQGITMF